LVSNRALCHAALQDWKRCQEDAARVTQLDAVFMKGWFMLAKAFWKQGSLTRALFELDRGLVALPGCEDLLKLQAEIKKDIADIARCAEGPPRVPAGRGPASRNPSPCQSRAPTPNRKSSKSPAPTSQRDPAENPPRQPPSYPPPPPRGYVETPWQDDDDVPFCGRPPPAPKSHRKASPSPGEGYRERPESWRMPRDSSPSPGLPRRSPVSSGMPPPDWSGAREASTPPRRDPSPGPGLPRRPPEFQGMPQPECGGEDQPRRRGPGSWFGAAAAFNVFRGPHRAASSDW